MFAEIMFLIVLILLNAFFAASEIALISLNDNKIKLMAEEGNKTAGIINKLLKEPSKFLATIQIGITLAGFLASAFAAESFSGRLVDVIKKTGVHIPDVWLRNTSVVIIYDNIIIFYTRSWRIGT
jgi:putative hemolysin